MLSINVYVARHSLFQYKNLLYHFEFSLILPFHLLPSGFRVHYKRESPGYLVHLETYLLLSFLLVFRGYTDFIIIIALILECSLPLLFYCIISLGVFKVPLKYLLSYNRIWNSGSRNYFSFFYPVIWTMTFQTTYQ